MMVLISYDVAMEDKSGPRRLRRIARACEDYGQRVQYSVFECLIAPDQWVKLRERLIQEMDPAQDSLRFYFLGAQWRHRVEHIGAKRTLDPEGPMIL